MCSIVFGDADRLAWIRSICEVQSDIASGKYATEQINIEIDHTINPEDLHPVHLVLLGCLIAMLRKHNLNGTIIANNKVIDYFCNQLHLDIYFNSDQRHIKSESPADLNLWRVSATGSLFYSNHVAEYLKNKYLCAKDLSPLKVILDELYANIADHSCAEDIAYSYIHYDEKNRTINIAFCDFGIGIPRSLQEAGIHAENGYIMKATGRGVSAKSNTHNKGFGLDTVVSNIEGTGNKITIISGDELFVSYGVREYARTLKQSTYLNGTLIYFDLPIDGFEDADYVNEYEFQL